MTDAKTDIQVTRVNGRWHCRLTANGKFIDEMACQYRTDVGYCCRTMMRWYDKTSGGNKHSNAVRNRMWNTEKYPDQKPEGRVWFYPEILADRRKHGIGSEQR